VDDSGATKEAFVSDRHRDTREFLAGLPERAVPALLHLLSCDDCTLNAVQSLRQEGGYGLGGEEEVVDYGEVFQQLEERTPGLLRAFEERSRQAQSLLADLLDVPMEERLRTVEREERFQEPHLAEVLLERSSDAQPKEPRRSEELARLALAVMQGGAPKTSAEYAASLRVRAGCLLGNALRLLRRLDEADAAFRQAAQGLMGPMDIPERAQLTGLLGHLRLAQGRIDEALALCWRAGYLYGLDGDCHQQGVYLAWIGLIYLDHEEPDMALPPLTHARVAVDAADEPVLACRVRLGLALCHAAYGRPVSARRLVDEARALYAQVKDHQSLVRFFWAEGRVAARSGRTQEALDLLLATRRRWLTFGRLPDAALTTLDIALVLAQVRKPEEIRPLIHEVLTSFPADPATKGMALALAAFEAIALEGQEEEDLKRAHALATAYVQRMGRSGPHSTES
jgi:tetratricopeptide (TPR) repeat protein